MRKAERCEERERRELEWNDAGGESTEITERGWLQEGGGTRRKKESEKGIYVTKAEGRERLSRRDGRRQVGWPFKFFVRLAPRRVPIPRFRDSEESPAG